MSLCDRPTGSFFNLTVSRTTGSGGFPHFPGGRFFGDLDLQSGIRPAICRLPFPAAQRQKSLYLRGAGLNLTANNADQRIFVPPGDEYLVGLGLLRVLLEEGMLGHFPSGQRPALVGALQNFSLERISQRTGVPASAIRNLARRFSRADRPLVLAEGQGLLRSSGLRGGCSGQSPLPGKTGYPTDHGFQ